MREGGAAGAPDKQGDFAMTQAAQINPQPAPAGWLHSPGFDKFFIFGTAALAILIGTYGLAFPQILPLIIIVNLWALGYHHVIATYTRLCFDRKSHKRALWMLYLLLPAVVLFVSYLASHNELWVIVDIYLYGQWFHYSRQSWGVSRAYERNAPVGYVADRSWQTQVAFYGFPIWGILYRSWQAPETFLTLPIKVLPVAELVMLAAGAVSIFFFAVWLLRVYKDWRAGVMPRAYVAFMLSHFTVFFVAYILMPTIDHGWLVANIWHNLQYLLFVWMFNNRRYKAGVDPEAPLISSLSQKKNMWLYFLVTLVITTAVYGGVYFSASSLGMLSALVVVYMGINFHHYIVDAIIWRANWIRRGNAPPATPNAATSPG